jgi:hypothetical protein
MRIGGVTGKQGSALKYNTGTLLMVLSRPVPTEGVAVEKKPAVVKTPKVADKTLNP